MLSTLGKASKATNHKMSKERNKNESLFNSSTQPANASLIEGHELIPELIDRIAGDYDRIIFVKIITHRSLVNYSIDHIK